VPVPLLFLIYISDMCQAHSDIYVFVDDAKLFRHVLNVNDCDTLQGGITTLHNWTKDWLLKLNVNKCKVVSFGRNVDNSYMYELIENNQSLHLARIY